MNHAQSNFSAVCAFKRGCWIAALAVLPLFQPAQAQAPDAKPVAAEATPNNSPPSASRNIYMAGGNVRPAASVTGDLYAAGGRVTVEHPVQGDATLAGGAVTVRAPIGEDHVFSHRAFGALVPKHT